MSLNAHIEVRRGNNKRFSGVGIEFSLLTNRMTLLIRKRISGFQLRQRYCLSALPHAGARIRKMYRVAQ